MDEKKRGIMLFPCPFKGHLKPMMQLADVLYANGFSITIIHHTHKYFSATTHPHFTLLEITGCSTENDLSHLSSEDIVPVTQKLIASSVEPLRNCLAMSLSTRTDVPIVCLIFDTVWSFSQAVAAEFNLPRMCLRTTSISALRALTALHSLINVYPQGLYSQQEAPVEELPPLKVKDLPLMKARAFDRTFHELSSTAIAQSNTSAGLILNSDEGLESEDLKKLKEDNDVPIYAIGPSLRRLSCSCIPAEDRSCLKWLDKQEMNSVLYVSFGSIATIADVEFTEIACGLVSSGVPFIWVLRSGLVTGLDCTDLLTTSVGEIVRERGCVVEWAPQVDILAHSSIGGFWTHSGWNSTFESLCEGVPMICSPNFGDQRVNARYVSDVWKVGIHMEGSFEKDAIEIAIRKLMENDEGKALRNNAAILKKKLQLSSDYGGYSSLHLQRLVAHISSFR